MKFFPWFVLFNMMLNSKKKFWTQNIFGHTFFFVKNYFLTKKFFWTPNFCGQKTSSGPKIFLDPNFFCTPIFLLTLKYFLNLKFYLGPIYFKDKNSFWIWDFGGCLRLSVISAEMLVNQLSLYLQRIMLEAPCRWMVEQTTLPMIWSLKSGLRSDVVFMQPFLVEMWGELLIRQVSLVNQSKNCLPTSFLSTHGFH